MTSLRQSLAGALANAATLLRKRDPHWNSYYADLLEEIAVNVQRVQRGEVTLDEFADFYDLTPKETAA